MATKTCPYCNEEIQLEAKKCKHCGEYLDPKLRRKNKSESNEPKEGCFLQTLNIGCIIVVIITVIIFVIFAVALGSA